MINIADFKGYLSTKTDREIAHCIFETDECAHVDEKQLEFISNKIASVYNISHESLTIKITGSAKLGYSLVEKKVEGYKKPRYREFSSESDIDCVVISQPIFTMIWDELSRYSHHQLRWPWQSGDLGNYLVSGWLRPDKFPVSLISGKLWWEAFNALSSSKEMNRRKVRGGLFFSEEQMYQYTERAIRSCKEI